VITLGFLTVEKSVENGYFESVKFRFDMPEGALPEGVSRDDMALYRYDGSSWSKLETSRRGDTYTATAPGFSVFAVGVDATDEQASTATMTSTPQQTPDTTPSPTPEAEIDITPATAVQSSSGISTSLSVVLGIAAGLVALLGIGLVRRKRQ